MSKTSTTTNQTKCVFLILILLELLAIAGIVESSKLNTPLPAKIIIVPETCEPNNDSETDIEMVSLPYLWQENSLN